jgi:hypothetical protein
MKGRGKVVEGSLLVGTGMRKKVGKMYRKTKAGKLEVGCPVATGQSKVIKLHSHCGVK